MLLILANMHDRRIPGKDRSNTDPPIERPPTGDLDLTSDR
jgi:hypothetical protein